MKCPFCTHQVNALNCASIQEQNLVMEDKLREHIAHEHFLSEGTTLRDQFAMSALTGMLANEHFSHESGPLAERSFKYADAMMERRKS